MISVLSLSFYILNRCSVITFDWIEKTRVRTKKTGSNSHYSNSLSTQVEFKDIKETAGLHEYVGASVKRVIFFQYTFVFYETLHSVVSVFPAPALLRMA